jgi:phage regulator Rha-like protein
MKKAKNLPALVKIVGDVPVVSTLDMWGPLEVEHNALLKMIRKYENKFSEIRPLGFQIRVGKRGGTPVSFCHLDEEQATFLITLMRNSDPVVDFKHRLTREFYRMRKEILRLQTVIAANRSNPEWITDRTDGIKEHTYLTDAVQVFVEYAIESGSKGYKHYYKHYNNMAYKALFDVEDGAKIKRDMMTGTQLKHLARLEVLIADTIHALLALKIAYKDIFYRAKDSAEAFALRVGKSIIPQLTGQAQQPLIGMAE